MRIQHDPGIVLRLLWVQGTQDVVQFPENFYEDQSTVSVTSEDIIMYRYSQK